MVEPFRLYRLPYILPTSELPTGRQSWGRQFWYHQSSGLPTLIMTIFFNVFCWILLDWVLGMFTEEFAILGKIPLKIVRIKSQQTKSNFKWWFGSLSQSFFSSATQIIIRFCTGPNHHYFPSDRLYSLIGVITSLATLWLVRLSLTLQCWLVVWLWLWIFKCVFKELA